ncbi:MAG: translocation/assembly module TamB, partial [Muribaculaceae bacterium]|nr:translocation/assembly module TamB [Muribaculaceae bacterium]
MDYFTNDSVVFDPGHIRASNVVVRDRYGNTAMLNGELSHRYFHDPRFEFRISEAASLLVYDINEQLNPDWYGTIFASGSGLVRGWPGVVMISVDMATDRNSAFTFVLSDTEAAGEYNFLTFSDVRKERQQAEADTIPDFLKAYRNKGSLPESNPTVVDMDLRMSVTPAALLTIVMDPVAGDKITARGAGSFNLPYNSQTDILNMYGKYTVDEGTYNFTLQDLILRDFTIKPGSSISFDGDPLNATLDMAAAYRVNTNLSDLDKSFSTDRDLNRTNVPVDAVLKVQGKMTSPNIDFDIELPTLTAEVERKVKSIISTEDQMSRQIIYLLALNRFYTPEYMGGGNSTGSELAAVASSTLSSQLANMLGQLTDKISLTPAIRSDKGDFSDVEVDLALSSRLLDNRLLVNGNFGYRDRTTSTTTFVGDFDIEYLL